MLRPLRQPRMGAHDIVTWLNYRRAEGGGSCYSYMVELQKGRGGVHDIVTWLNYRRAEGGGS